MCVKFGESPMAFPFYRDILDNLHERILYVPVLGKRVNKVDGRHVSGMNSNFTFPIRSFAWDKNCVIGSHDQCLHLAPNAFTAQSLSGYGDHTLVAIPSKNYWTDGDSYGRCHHTDGMYSLFCVECEGYGLEEASLPEFWNKEVPRGLVAAIIEAAQHGAYVGQVIRERS